MNRRMDIMTLTCISIFQLFSNCVDAFRFIQLGGAFERDFGQCMLIIDAFRMRMLRWGNAVGVSLDPQFDVHQLPISTLLNSAIRLQDPERYSGARSTRRLPLVYTELPPLYARLHEQMEDIALDREKDGPFLIKKIITIQSRRDFDDLVDGLKFDLMRLETLFPMEYVIHRGMADVEVAEMHPDLQSLKAFRRAAEHIGDTAMEDSLRARIDMIELKNTWSTEEADGM